MSLAAVLAASLLLAGPAAAPEKADPAKAAARPAGGGEAPAVTSPGVVDASGEWRGARWGMSVEEVLAHFKGEAKRVEPELRLADGNVVALRLDGLQLAGRKVRAGFVFSASGLALVSLRTLEAEYAPAEAFTEASRLVGEVFGGPGAVTTDDNFVDMRQETWTRAKGAVDLKYIPGVLVLMYRPPVVAEPPPLLKKP